MLVNFRSTSATLSTQCKMRRLFKLNRIKTMFVILMINAPNTAPAFTETYTDKYDVRSGKQLTQLTVTEKTSDQFHIFDKKDF